MAAQLKKVVIDAHVLDFEHFGYSSYGVSGEGTLDSPIAGLIESDYATVTPETKIELLQSVLSDAKLAIVTEREGVVGIVTKIDLIDFLARKSGKASIAPARPA